MPDGWARQLDTFLQQQLNTNRQNPGKVYGWLDNFLRMMRGQSVLLSLNGMGEFGNFHYEPQLADAPLEQIRAQLDDFHAGNLISASQYQRLQRIREVENCRREMQNCLEIHSDFLKWKLDKIIGKAQEKGWIGRNTAIDARNTADNNPPAALMLLQEEGALRNRASPGQSAMELKVDLETEVIHDCFVKLAEKREDINRRLNNDQRQAFDFCMSSHDKETAIELVQEYCGKDFIAQLV